MPIVAIHNVGRVGIIKDQPSHELPPEAWTDGQNIRIADGVVEKFLGHSAVFGTPTVAPYLLMPVPQKVTYFWLYAGLAKVYVTDGTTHTDLTRITGGDYSASIDDSWNGGILGTIPILNNGVDDPQMWKPTEVGQPLLLLSNWPANTKAKVIRVFKSFLIALNITKTSTNFPTMVKWSHPADPGTVPVSWDETDATKDAGEKELADADFLVDCLPLRDINMLYREGSVWGQQFIGGTFIFRHYRIFGEFGLLTSRCVREFFGKHFVVAAEDIVLHNGQSAESIITNKLRRAIFNNLDQSNFARSFVIPQVAKKEMWFCYPTSGSSLPDRALIWNWDENTFTFRDLPQAADIALGVVSVAGARDWDSQNYTWDSASAAVAWDARAYSAIATSLLMAVPGGPSLFHVEQTNQFDGTNMTSYIERTGMSVVGQDRYGNPKTDTTRRKFINRVWPRIRASGPIDVWVGGQEQIDGAVTWSGPYSFDPNNDTDTGIPVAVNTRIPSFKFESTNNVTWKLDSYAFDVQLAGMY